MHNDPLNYTDPTGMSSNNCDTYSTNASSCKTGAVFRDSEKTERGSAHAQERDIGNSSNDPGSEWTFQTNIGGYGDSARVFGGRYIKVEVGTVALGVGGAHVYVMASPLDVDGNILPTMRKNTADWNVGGHRVTSVRGGRPTVLDAGYDNQNGFQWNVWIPRQESAHGSSASVFVNIYTKRDD